MTKWKGQEYTASSGPYDWEEIRKRLTPHCKKCGSETDLGSVQKKCAVAFHGRMVETGWVHDYWECDKCFKTGPKPE